MTILSDIPGWSITELGSLGQWGSGGTPSRSILAYYEGGHIPWLVIGDLNEGIVFSAKATITEAGLENSSAKLLPPGVLLVAMYGSIGKTSITGVPCATNQAIAFCIPHTGVNLGYLHRAIQWAKPALVAQGQGGAQQNISQGILKAHLIPVAPEAEQKRIADKLDTVLTRVDAVNTRLVRVAPLLKRFRQSVLAAAFTGRLTNVAATALPSSWQTVTLGSLITHGPKNGLYKPSSAYGDGVRILRIDSFYDGKVSDWGGLRLLSVDSSELKQFGLKNGDIVINRVNSIEYLGKCALIEGLQGECVFESNMMKFRLSSELANPHFVRAWLCSEDARTQIVGKAKHAVNQASINQSDVCSLKLQLPPLSEQTEIVRRVETLFALADRLEARLAQAQTAATRLTPALLAKAFRGELVPQDPNDEPAAELLRRLQQKASSNSEKRRRKSST